MNRLRVAIIGGSGYTGGELARLLLFHPHIELTQVVSSSHAGQYLRNVHPNLRKADKSMVGTINRPLRFSHPEDLSVCDILFLCLPHGIAAREIKHYRAIAPRIIDLSADFRLRSAGLYEEWYGASHSASYLLEGAIYGLPELHRAKLPGATLVSGTGCMATAAILGLAPLYRAGLVDNTLPLVVDAKVGSSAAGAAPGPGSHHPDRSGAVRSFQPTGHRHTAELIQELGLAAGLEHHQYIAFTATAVELVRGVLVTAQLFLNETVDERTLWRLYREVYQQEPFIRLVKERSGVYRYPEPKILVGSNYCDIGFELETHQQKKEMDGRRLVIIAALDNLMKGAAGNAVQALNCMCGWDESTGLTFPGLHPV